MIGLVLSAWVLAAAVLGIAWAAAGYRAKSRR